MAKNDNRTLDFSPKKMAKLDKDIRKSVADRMRKSDVPHSIVKEYMEKGKTGIPQMDRYIASHGDNALGELTEEGIKTTGDATLNTVTKSAKEKVKFPMLEKNMSSASPKEASLQDFIKNKVNQGKTTGFVGIDNDIVGEATRTGNTTKLRTNVEKEIDNIRKKVVDRTYKGKKMGLGDLEDAAGKAMDLRRQIPPNAPSANKMAMRMNALKSLAGKGADVAESGMKLARKAAPYARKAARVIPGLQVAAGAYDMMDQPELGAAEGSVARKLEDGTASVADREALLNQGDQIRQQDRPSPHSRQIEDTEMFKKIKGYFTK